MKPEESCAWGSGFLAVAGVWREAFLPTMWPEAGTGGEANLAVPASGEPIRRPQQVLLMQFLVENDTEQRERGTHTS